MTDEQAAKDPSLRAQLLAAAREFSLYLPEPLEPEDCDELMHILEPVVTTQLAVLRDLLRQREEEIERLKRLADSQEFRAEQAEGKMRERYEAWQQVTAKLAVMTAKYQEMVKLYDKHHGTPCEEIRHKQEVEALVAQLAAMQGPGSPYARWQRMLEALERRFPDPQPYQSSCPAEARYLEAIDGLIAQLAALRALLRQREEEIEQLSLCGCVDDKGHAFAACQGCKGTGTRSSI